MPKDNRSAFTGPNSRPVNHVSVLSNLFWRKLYVQIQNYFSSNNLITGYCHAYREGHSTSTALSQMTDDWLKSIDDRRLVGALTLDFSAAFDVIDHYLWLGNLKCYGFKCTALPWMKSYPSKKRQRVFSNGSFSDSKDIQHGVPQDRSYILYLQIISHQHYIKQEL